MENEKQILAVKAGIWYTVSNFIMRSISILTTPIFTRLMSLSEYGDYSNFISWFNIISILATLDLHATLNRARFDYKDDIDSYISCITFTGICIPSILYLIVMLNSKAFSNILNMDIISLHCLFLSVIFSSATNIFQAKQRIFYKYKESVIIAFITTLITVLTSLFLVIIMKNKLYGRILGQSIPAIIINIVIAFFLISKGKKMKSEYITYAINISLPYIPHLLAMNILSQYDRIQIKQFCSSVEVAYYSLAYSCALIVNVFLNSLNSAWSPWLGDMLNLKKYDYIRKVSKKYVLIFFVIVIGVFLISPEFLLFFGGKEYSSAIYVMPAIISGSVFQFIYTMYVNIEMFEKKMWGVAGATIIAAILNITLNYIFIPKLGYISAAYNTLISYAVLCLLHYLLVKRIGLAKVYDTKFIINIIILTILINLIIYILYNYFLLRVFIIIVYSIVFIYILFKNKVIICKILNK